MMMMNEEFAAGKQSIKWVMKLLAAAAICKTAVGAIWTARKK